MSNSLVFLSKNNLPLTTSLIIAEALERKHKFIIELIRNHEDDLNAVCGRVTFQTAPFDTAGGTQNREIAFLNEQQTTLLITFMTNTPKVVKFKIALVKAFYEMRQALAQQSLTFTADELAILKDKALKQGYAIACQKFKGQRTLGEGEIAIPKDSAKRLYLFLDNLSDKYQEIQNTVIAMNKCSSIIQHISNNMFATRESMKDILFKNL